MTDNQCKSINPTQSGGIAAASEVDSFVADLRQRRRSIVDKPLARGRLIFGLDATASGQPTWDTAYRLPAVRPEARVLVYYQWTNAQSDNKLRIVMRMNGHAI